MRGGCTELRSQHLLGNVHKVTVHTPTIQRKPTAPPPQLHEPKPRGHRQQQHRACHSPTKKSVLPLFSTRLDGRLHDLQVLARPGQGPAGAHPGHEGVDLPGGLRPQLGSGGLAVDLETPEDTSSRVQKQNKTKQSRVQKQNKTIQKQNIYG